MFKRSKDGLSPYHYEHKSLIYIYENNLCHSQAHFYYVCRHIWSAWASKRHAESCAALKMMKKSLLKLRKVKRIGNLYLPEFQGRKGSKLNVDNFHGLPTANRNYSTFRFFWISPYRIVRARLAPLIGVMCQWIPFYIVRWIITRSISFGRWEICFHNSRELLCTAILAHQLRAYPWYKVSVHLVLTGFPWCKPTATKVLILV